MNRAEVRVNVAAIERNVTRLVQAAPGAAVCAVVKADGYGHGMMPAARAALAGGASTLAVATAAEAAALREGLDGGADHDVSILLLGALTEQELDLAVAAQATVTAWTTDFVQELTRVAGAASATTSVHVKLDTGLGRLGTRDAAAADAVAALVAGSPSLELAGAWTHFATADELEDDFFAEQLRRFRHWVDPLRAEHRGLVVHAANSAATLREPASHFDMVRCGIAIYGMDPFGIEPGQHGLEPAMDLRSTVAAVKSCSAGESVGYGRRFVADADTVIATVPVGYGDGYRRALGNRADVLIGGARYPVRGAVSMDNVTVELGPETDVTVGDTATLLGSCGSDAITAEQLAELADTINYEITCAINGRPTRIWHNDGVPR